MKNAQGRFFPERQANILRRNAAMACAVTGKSEHPLWVISSRSAWLSVSSCPNRTLGTMEADQSGRQPTAVIGPGKAPPKRRPTSNSPLVAGDVYPMIRNPIPPAAIFQAYIGPASSIVINLFRSLICCLRGVHVGNDCHVSLHDYRQGFEEK